MTASTFFIPSVNVIGNGALKDAMNTMKDYGYRRALIVTDAVLNKLGVAADIQKRLQEYDILSVWYSTVRIRTRRPLTLKKAWKCCALMTATASFLWAAAPRTTARRGSRWLRPTAAIFVTMKALTVLLNRSCR